LKGPCTAIFFRVVQGLFIGIFGVS